jgi:membrane-bound ClpP family serine protease
VADLLDQPAVVLICLTLAAALFIIEVALPTLGIAGSLSVLLGIAAIVGIQRQDTPWWPLLLAVAAVALWVFMIARRSTTPIEQLLAAGLFAVGSITYGVLAHDIATVIIGVIGTVKGVVGFPLLHRAAIDLLEKPPLVGMDAFVGETAEVVRWEGLSGTVRIGGSLWNATSPMPLRPGDEVEITGYSGMTVEVAPVVHH